MNDWKSTLRQLFSDEYRERFKEKQEERKGKLRLKQFISGVVEPAFEEIADALGEYGRDVEIQTGKNFAAIRVIYEKKEEFYFAVKIKPYGERKFMFPVMPIRDEAGQTYRAIVHLKEVKEREVEHDVTNYTRAELIDAFLFYYRRHFEWRH